MRITGGDYGGRILESPTDRTIRPTSDKVRQAIFNMLNARGAVDGAVVLDGFCGTGALGIEALSWGAASCTFIDKNRRSLDLARKNHAALGITAKSDFLLKDCAKPGLRPADIAAANLVFLDPPYKQDLIPQALAGLAEARWLAPDAHILIESEKSFDPAMAGAGFNVVLTRDYGDTRVALLVASALPR